jgi:hypothetical protein
MIAVFMRGLAGGAPMSDGASIEMDYFAYGEKVVDQLHNEHHLLIVEALDDLTTGSPVYRVERGRRPGGGGHNVVFDLLQ